MHVNTGWLDLDFINRDIDFWYDLQPYTIIEWYNEFDGKNFGPINIFSPYVYKTNIQITKCNLYSHKVISDFAKSENLYVCNNEKEKTSFRNHDLYHYERSFTNYSKIRNFSGLIHMSAYSHWVGNNSPSILLFLGKIIPLIQSAEFGTHFLAEVLIGSYKAWLPMFNHTLFGFTAQTFLGELP